MQDDGEDRLQEALLRQQRRGMAWIDAWCLNLKARVTRVQPRERAKGVKIMVGKVTVKPDLKWQRMMKTREDRKNKIAARAPGKRMARP